MQRDPNQAGFADAFVVGGGNSKLERIDKLIDWDALERGVGISRENRTGRPGYPIQTLLKVLLLQAWYGLSDPAMEEALDDRMSFRRFVGLGLGERVPDHSTLSRFRTELAKGKRWEALLDAVNRQLDARGVILKRGTLIDATLVDAAASEPPKQRGGGRSEVDPEARWTKRPNGMARFGYKLHVAMDQGSQIVRRMALTPANVNEITLAPELICGDEAALFADKGYASAPFQQQLKDRGIKERVQRKASRSRQLTRWEVLRNKLIGRQRGRIEGVFGVLKRSYGLARMRFMGLARNAVATCLTLVAWNLSQAARRA